MECSEPGAIRDEELAAYLAGDKVRPEVAQHLSRCQTCSSQVATYQRIDLQLTNKLLRWDCPYSQVLGEYQLGMLATTQLNEVRSHLLYCFRCSAEVATLTEFLTNDPFLVESPVIQSTLAVRPATSNHRLPVQEALRSLDQWRERAVENARRVVAALVSPQPRFAIQRGAATSSSWPRNYAAEDVHISVQLEQMTHRRDALQVIGFVKRNGTALETLEGTPVRLLSSTGSAYTELIDELGNFVFSAVPPATYSLEVQFSETIVVIEQLLIETQE